MARTIRFVKIRLQYFISQELLLRRKAHQCPWTNVSCEGNIPRGDPCRRSVFDAANGENEALGNGGDGAIAGPRGPHQKHGELSRIL